MKKSKKKYKGRNIERSIWRIEGKEEIANEDRGTEYSMLFKEISQSGALQLMGRIMWVTCPL